MGLLLGEISARGTLPIGVYYDDANEDPVTGLTGATAPKLSIRRGSDGYTIDFNDDTFKAAGHTTPTLDLAEVGGGFYEIAAGWNLLDITNPVSGDRYYVRVATTGVVARKTWVGMAKVDGVGTPVARIERTWALVDGDEELTTAATGNFTVKHPETGATIKTCTVRAPGNTDLVIDAGQPVKVTDDA